MSDWKEYTLGDISRNISRRFDFNAYPNVVFINTGDVLNNKFLHCDISNVKDLPGQAKKAIKKGDILYSEIRPGNGRYLFVDNDLDNYVVSTKFMVIEPNANIVLPEFLFLLLISNETTEYFKIIAESRSGTFPQITFDSVSSLSLNIPDKETQQKILDIIIPLDGKIEIKTQINQTLEQISQALFKSWFVDFDPVRAKVQALSDGMSFEQAELAAMQAISGKTPEELTALSQTQPDRYAELVKTAKAFPCEIVEVDGVEVPKGWEVKPLGDLISFVKGKKPKAVSPNQEENMLPHILTSSLEGKYNEFCESNKLITVEYQNTIMLMDGSNSGRVAIGHNGVIGSTLAKINLDNNKLWAIIYQFLKHKEADIQANTTGTTIPHTDKNRVNNYLMVIPNNFLLEKITELFDNSLLKIISNRNQIISLETTRNLLLPRLLSGEFQYEQKYITK